MQRRLPSLNSLRSFEAAGRHLSFTDAAAELFVTQAAISHQVKALETYLGAALFIRHPRKLELTESGQRLLPVVQGALDSISVAVTDIRKEENITPVSAAVPPTFGARWLSPRLNQLLREYPQIELSLRHTNIPVDFTSETVDIAVIYGNGKWRGLLAKPILKIDFCPMCAPSLIENSGPLSSPEDLQKVTLLHDADHQIWSNWLQLVDADHVDATRGTVFDDTNVLIQAAVNGLGVAMCSENFVKEHLADGRLVRLFDVTLTTQNAYFAVCPRENLAKTEVKLIWDWLLSQAE